MALPAYGTDFSYAAYTFPTNCKTKVTEQPVFSDDGRVIKWSEVRIDVTWFLLLDETTAGNVVVNVQATATATVDAGQLTALVVTNGGSGYTAPPAISFTGGGGGAGAAATTIVTGGVVTGYAIQDQGAGYTLAPTVTIGAPPVAPPPAPVTTDAAVENIRRQLGKAGKRLVYANKGFAASNATVNGNAVGSLIVDPNGPISDVNFGPKPGSFSFVPLGGAPLGNIAGMCSWSVTTSIPECTTANYKPGPKKLTQLAYTVDYSIDKAGFVTITFAGSMEIPLQLGADGVSAPGSVDDNWEDVCGPVPEGFQREIKRTVSADRRRIDFSITLTQLPAPLPNDIVSIELRQRTHNPRAGVVTQWLSTISGSVTTSATIEKNMGWRWVYYIIGQRIANTLRTAQAQTSGGWNVTGSQSSPVGINSGNCAVLIQNFSAEEDIFSNTCSFSMSYRILGADLSNILHASGIWQPVNGDWKAWRDSLAGNAQHPRGWLRLVYPRGADTFMDVCGTAPPGVAVEAAVNEMPEAPVATGTDPGPLASAGAPPEGFASEFQEPATLAAPDIGDDFGVVVNGPDDGSGGSLLSFIDPASSWSEYDCDVVYSEDGGQVRHKPLTGTLTYTPPAVDPLGAVAPVMANTAAPVPGTTVSVPDIIQQAVSPSATVTVSGHAARLGYKIDPPRLVQYAGMQLGPPASRDVNQKPIAFIQGIPLWAAVWRITYLLPTLPAKLPTAANPQFGVDGGA